MPFGKVKLFHHAEHLPHFHYRKFEDPFVLYLKKAVKQKSVILNFISMDSLCNR